jgi:hypothetical protein
VRRFLIFFPVVLALILLCALAVPKGEIVILHSVDAAGTEQESSLWVVEIEGWLHLRSGRPRTRWLERISARPLVELERGGQVHAYHAVAVRDPVLLAAVNDAIARKYGVADRVVRTLLDVNRSVAVRLEPLEGRDADDD